MPILGGVCVPNQYIYSWRSLHTEPIEWNTVEKSGSVFPVILPSRHLSYPTLSEPHNIDCQLATAGQNDCLFKKYARFINLVYKGLNLMA